ncbi:RNA-guided endonuclease TnpB family protein [Streptomyces sp. NBS 14/10]|uniref:RNA-guided endonuclease InsQ/TnpB family protein n=1 Tax=Streptomyces sp. NBS 14/10 TaxID=1945643 RepID=UPI00211ADD8B|nr:transposase [Streptomyces sp. NBS 14/10]KAK1186463.1 RNA-guided endonuclease TnpB family protein [Streptomyces sp. NBS 14/10]
MSASSDRAIFRHKTTSTVIGVKLRYNVRVYPSASQRGNLARAFGSARVVWNDALRVRRDAYARGLPRLTATKLSKQVVTEAKKTPERAWLGEVSVVVLQQSLRDLEAAYSNFFASKNGTRRGPAMGPPRMKKKTARQAIRFTANARWSITDGGKLRLPKIGDIQVRWSRELPCEPSSVTIVKDPSGRYFASFVIEVEDKPWLGLDVEETDTGIDLGLSSYAVLRGRKIASPKFFRRQERKLRRAQRGLSRKQKGSNNRRKARRAVARIHARIADQRRDFIEKETTRIVRESQAVYVEDLNVKGMATRRGRLGKSVHDQSLGIFVRTLKAKCKRYGRTFVAIDQWFPSTQLCCTPACGRLTGPKGREQLHIRAWTCTGCGTRHDRDENAEVNIRAAGRKRAAEMRREAERQNACGEHVRPRTPGQRSSKQEPTRSPTAAGGGAGGNHPRSRG